MIQSSATLASARAGSRLVPALAAFFLGAALFALAGFAAPDAIHNATHDTRHAFGLPCH